MVKKIMVLCVLAVGLISIQPVRANSLNKTVNKTETTTTPAQEERSKQIRTRLFEIKAMDLSSLSSSEKKALRKEVRAIKKEMKEMSGGIYFSVGAIIIILLLLIILL
jgi:hypothetical protein